MGGGGGCVCSRSDFTRMHLAMMRNDKVPVILGQDHLRYTYVFELVVV